MSRFSRAEDIGSHYIDMGYDREVAEAILNDFRIEFDLNVDDWKIDDDIEENYWEVYIYTEFGEEIISLYLDTDGTIGTFNVNEDLLKELVPVMKCPSCETGDLEHRAVDNPRAMNEEKKTHLYICDQCPMVMVEWYDTSDSEAFAKGIK